MYLHIETDRLILRQFIESDAADASYNSQQPTVAHFIHTLYVQESEFGGQTRVYEIESEA